MYSMKLTLNPNKILKDYSRFKTESGSRQEVSLNYPAIDKNSENYGVTAESGCVKAFQKNSMNKLLNCWTWNLVLLVDNTHRSEEMGPSICNQKEDEAFCGLLLAKHKVKVWDYIRKHA